MDADCEESLYGHILQYLLMHVVFSHVSYVASKSNPSPQLICTKYLRDFLRVVTYLIVCTICSEEVP